MNDVRNLMHNLGGEVDYKEFGAASGAAGAWPLLKRLERVADGLQAATPAPSDPEPALATQLRAAAVARSGRGLSLGQYAASPAARPSAPSVDDGRHLPLTDVFARLARTAR